MSIDTLSSPLDDLTIYEIEADVTSADSFTCKSDIATSQDEIEKDAEGPDHPEPFRVPRSEINKVSAAGLETPYDSSKVEPAEANETKFETREIGSLAVRNFESAEASSDTSEGNGTESRTDGGDIVDPGIDDPPETDSSGRGGSGGLPPDKTDRGFQDPGESDGDPDEPGSAHAGAPPDGAVISAVEDTIGTGLERHEDISRLADTHRNEEFKRRSLANDSAETVAPVTQGSVEASVDKVIALDNDVPELAHGEQPANPEFGKELRACAAHNATTQVPELDDIERGLLCDLRDGAGLGTMAEVRGTDIENIEENLEWIGIKFQEAGFSLASDEHDPLEGYRRSPFYVLEAMKSEQIAKVDYSEESDPELTPEEQRQLYLISAGFNAVEAAVGLEIPLSESHQLIDSLRSKFGAATVPQIVGIAHSRGLIPGIQMFDGRPLPDDPYEELRPLSLDERLDLAGKPELKPEGELVGACNFRDFRMEADHAVDARYNSAVRLRRELMQLGDEGYNAAVILGELLANYMTIDENGYYFVYDTDVRHLVVSRDQGTGHLVIDYYSFAEVKESTFNNIGQKLDPKAYSVEEKLLIGERDMEPDDAKVGVEGEHGRGFALIVAHSLNREENRLGIGGHLRIEVNPNEVNPEVLRNVLQESGGIVLGEEEVDDDQMPELDVIMERLGEDLEEDI